MVVRIFKKSEAAKKFVNGLTNARVIAIVENNDTGDNGDTKYEVYGWDSGLELTEITVTTEMTDGVAYQVTLANGTIAQEGSLPMSLFNTDEATTDLMVDGLLAGGTEWTVPAILRFYPLEGQAKIGNDVPLTLQRSSCTSVSGTVTMPPAPTSTKPAEAFPGCGLPSNYVFLNDTGQAAANPPVLQYTKGSTGTATTWGASIVDTDIRKDYVNGEYVVILATYAGVPK